MQSATLLTNLLKSAVTSPVTLCQRWRSNWRYNDVSIRAAWPNYKPHLTHRRHFHEPHTFGVQRTTRLRCVDNSAIGMQAMAEGRPPKIINVYSQKHQFKPHSTYGQLGDKVLCAVKGEKIKGILVGLRVNSLPGIPRFDTNNVVLIDDAGTPLGTRIHAPIPMCIRPRLKRMSKNRRSDFTKIMAIATSFV